jgi:putative endonuclease
VTINNLERINKKQKLLQKLAINLHSLSYFYTVKTGHPERSRRRTFQLNMSLCLYILKCADNSYYTGVTNNLELRLQQHNIGWSKTSYTYSRRPVELVFYEVFLNYSLCIEWEKKIKGWSRAKKEAFINGNYAELIKLSACKNESHYSNYKKEHDE